MLACISSPFLWHRLWDLSVLSLCEWHMLLSCYILPNHRCFLFKSILSTFMFLFHALRSLRTLISLSFSLPLYLPLFFPFLVLSFSPPMAPCNTSCFGTRGSCFSCSHESPNIFGDTGSHCLKKIQGTLLVYHHHPGRLEFGDELI